MSHFRGLIVTILIGLTIFFNLERLNLAQANVINLASFVYIIGIVALISTIAIPILWRSSVVVSFGIWLSIYFLCKIFLFNDRLIIGGIYTYLTITEVSLLSVLIWLGHKVAYTLHDFEEAIANISLAQVGSRVRPLEKASDAIKGEMLRSRRFHRPLSVVVIIPEPESIKARLHHIVQEIQRAMMARYVFTSLAHVISNYVERTNLVIEHSEQNRFILLCPETEAADTDQLIEHIRTIAAEKMGVSLACGAASFPEQALTFEELINQAEKNLNHPEKVPRVSVVRAVETSMDHSSFLR
jgi:hypothetical protein